MKPNTEIIKANAEKKWRELAAEKATQYFGRFIPEVNLKATEGKFKDWVEPRWYACAYLRAHGLSLRKIANILHYSDHTSVMHGRDKARERWTKEHFEKIALVDEQDVQGKAWSMAA